MDRELLYIELPDVVSPTDERLGLDVNGVTVYGLYPKTERTYELVLQGWRYHDSDEGESSGKYYLNGVFEVTLNESGRVETSVLVEVFETLPDDAPPLS